MTCNKPAFRGSTPRHLMRSTRLILFLTGVVSLSGCEQPTPTSQPSAATKPGPKNSAEKVDQLRSLPYSGFVSAEEDDEANGVVFRDAVRSQTGVTLYTMERLSRAELIDETGKSLRTWRDERGLDWYHTELLENGDLLVVGATRSEAGGRELPDDARYVARYSWDGGLIWKRNLATHHDVELTPSGKLLTMTIRRRMEPEWHAEIPVRDEPLALVDAADGTPIDSLSLYDAIKAAPDVFPLQKVNIKTRGGQAELDLLHSNSCQWLRFLELAKRDAIYGQGNVLVCFRSQDRIAIFDWEKKRAVWAWGAGEISGPHDAQMLPTGNILLFDNGIAHERSRVIELDPLKKTIVWQYNPDPPKKFFTLTKGSAQRLANGNTLIANSDNGQAFEITPTGEWVWDFRCPHRGSDGKRATIVRAIRYDRGKIAPLRGE